MKRETPLARKLAAKTQELQRARDALEKAKLSRKHRHKPSFEYKGLFGATATLPTPLIVGCDEDCPMRSKVAGLFQDVHELAQERKELMRQIAAKAQQGYRNRVRKAASAREKKKAKVKERRDALRGSRALPKQLAPFYGKSERTLQRDQKVNRERR